MKRSLIISRSVALLAAATTLGARQHAFARVSHDTCGAVGVYAVGQSLTPIRPVTPRVPARRAVVSRGAQEVSSVTVPLAPRGTLEVRSYAGCGQPTRGSFSVQYGIVRPLPAYSRGAAGAPAQPAAPTRTLSGTFTEAGGSGASSSISVKAVLTTTTQDAHARTRAVVTRVAMDVTGSLEVASDNRSAVLTFTQPGGSSRDAMVIYGHRGLDRPNTQ